MHVVKKIFLVSSLLSYFAVQAGPVEVLKKYKSKTGAGLIFLKNETLFALYGIGMGVGVLAALTGTRAGLQVVDYHGYFFNGTTWDLKEHGKSDGIKCAALTTCGLGTVWGIRLAWYCFKKGSGRVVDMVRGSEPQQVKKITAN